MHELSLCFNLLATTERVAAEHDALGVARIFVSVGPLSGVEPHLLERAWPLAAAGTVAAHAELVIETMDVVVRCDQCAAETTVRPNRLLCGRCGGYRTQVISGQEMLLRSLELEKPDVSGDTDANTERGRVHGTL